MLPMLSKLLILLRPASACFCAPAAVHENFMVLVQVPNSEMGELEGGRTSAYNLGSPSLSAAGNDEDMPVLCCIEY
jgi:hypothetical protein